MIKLSLCLASGGATTYSHNPANNYIQKPSIKPLKTKIHEFKRQFLRSSHRLEDNIKIDYNYTVCEGLN